MEHGWLHPDILRIALVLALIGLGLRPRRGYYRPATGAAIASLRVVAAGALAILAGGFFLRAAGGFNLVVLADVSGSMDGGRRQALEETLADIERTVRDRGALTVVSFAGGGRETAPGRVDGETLDRSRTDLETAISAVLPCFGPRTRNRLLILSDGQETAGRAELAIPELIRRKVQVAAADFSRIPTGEVELLRMTAPDRVLAGQNYEIKALVGASGVPSVTVALERDGKPAGRTQVTPDQAGTGEAVFYQEAAAPGRSRLRLRVEGSGSDQPANNVLEDDVFQEGMEQVTLVTEDHIESDWLARSLRSGAARFRVTDPAGLAADWGAVAASDVVVFDDIPASSLPEDLVASMTSAVRDRGTGMVFVGGGRSFGAGEYQGSTLQQILPVTMETMEQGPDKEIGMVVVLDKSFSMYFRGPGERTIGGNAPRKIDLARAAINETIRVLRPEDRVGILLSGDQLEWLRQPSPLGQDRKDIEERLHRVSAIGGGINFYSSLLESYQKLQAIPPGVRHLMVICDSNDIDQYEVQNRGRSHELIRNMERDGITLSVFAIGRPTDKDIAFLKVASSLGKGDFYLVSDMVYLPQYFVADFKRKKEGWTREEPFVPLVKNYSPLIDGIVADTIPEMTGIDLVTAKAGADEVLISPFGSPLLVSWRYGKGRVTAFTGDGVRKWTAGWRTWIQSQAFWRQMVYATARRRRVDHVRIGARLDPGGGRALFTIPDAGPSLPGSSPTVELETGAKALTLPLERVGFLDFRAVLPDLSPGSYRFTIRGEGEESGGRRLNGNLIMPAPLEYATRLPGKAVLNGLVEGTGGFWLQGPSDILRDVPPAARPAPDFLFWLALVGLTAMLAEFLLRY